jgi:hypothetical protein
MSEIPVVSPLGHSRKYVLAKPYPLYDTPIFQWYSAIPAGFVYDGASIPSFTGFTWAVTYSPFRPEVMRAALVHDFLCNQRPTHFSSAQAADLFFDMLIADGAKPWKARLMRRGVNFAGPKW